MGNNGALDEAMEIIKGSIADNNEVEQPYHTKGKIFIDENGNVISIYIQGIIVDFECSTVIDPDTAGCYSEKELEEDNWKKVISRDETIEDWIMELPLSSREWDGKERNYFDF